MQLPEGVLINTCYEILEDSLIETDNPDVFLTFENPDVFLTLEDPDPLTVHIADNITGVYIIINSSGDDIKVRVETSIGDYHWIDFIASKLERFIKDNLKEYTIKEYAYIASTIVMSIREALEPIFNFEICTSTAKRAL